MSLYEASFRLRHDCPYRALSERFPDVTVREWHHGECQLLEIVSPATSDDDLVAAVEDLGTVLHRSVDGTGLHLVTRACRCSLADSVVERFEAHDCLYQPPTVHRQGWEHYTVVAFDAADVRALHEDLRGDRDVEVVSKTELSERRVPHSMLAPVDRLFADLTDRQLAALRLALDCGYYEQPRACTVAELAERTTVARATFEEHLRKAENEVLRSAGRFARLLDESRPGEGLFGERAGAAGD